MGEIKFDEFKRMDIRVGKIIRAEKIKGSNKLLKLKVDFGKQKKQIIAGLGKFYKPESLLGKECPFVFNLETKTLNGLESQGMILCADDNVPVLLHPDKEVNPGSIIK